MKKGRQRMERWLRRRRSQEKGRAEGGRRRHDRGSRAWVPTYVEYEKFEVAERERERERCLSSEK